jgi:hypothetical protein
MLRLLELLVTGIFMPSNSEEADRKRACSALNPIKKKGGQVRPKMGSWIVGAPF